MHAPVFWIAESVRCSRAAGLVGRIILAEAGLYFVPGKRSLAARRTDQTWLSHALSDDDGLEVATFADIAAREPAEQVAAIPGALHLAPAALTDLALAGRTITVAADPPLAFTLPPVLGASLLAWHARMAALRATTEQAPPLPGLTDLVGLAAPPRSASVPGDIDAANRPQGPPN
jgi:hypothetical protein